MISPAELAPELEKYQVFEEIGHGGMATVYRGYDRRLDREVAIKIIHRHLRENREVSARFVSEAKAVAKVKHPNIVEVYDVSDPDEAERYLVVELVRGTTLRRLLSDHGHVPAEIAAAISLEIAGALEHAHRHGVIHRDMKPENVLVEIPPANDTRRAPLPENERLPPRIKITDFGIAKLLDAQGVTSTGQVLGSPSHMSPEQIEGGEVSARSDVFGLGVLLYECMVGKLPFDGKNPAQVLRRVLDGSFTPADRARPTVGAGYARILAKALAREPADRYPSAADLSDDLRSELKLVGFDDPRRELERFLTHSEAYATEYVPRVCERLVEVGRRARTEGDVALAASCFNRALAFRPDDTELLSLVSGLARSERVREIARRSALIAVGGVTLGLAVFGTARLFSPPVTVGSSALKPVLRTPHARANERPVSVVQSGNPVPSVPVPGTTASAKLRLPAVPLVPRPKPTRVVQVHIRGAAGRLKIDGVETPWYGRTHTLEVGRHVLEFIPPNLDCCIAPEPKAIDVRSGDGIQVESGEIRFKDAVVSFVGPQGSEASCADLATHLGPGSSKSVQMSGSQLDVSCTIFPPPSAGADPRTEQVSLHPGATAVLSWP